MHRWFFVNEREKCELKDSDEGKSTIKLSEEQEQTEEIPSLLWPFCCSYDEELEGNETIAITGSCTVLGNWNPAGAFAMTQTPNTNQFEAMVNLPRDKDIEFRYIKIAWNPFKEELIVRSWETHHKPRVVRKCDNLLKDCDTYGWQGTKYNVNRAWNLYETYVHFKIFKAPFYFPNDLKERLLYVKITPMYPKAPPECNTLREDQPMSLFTQKPLEQMYDEKCAEMGLSTEFAFVECCTLSSATDKELVCQPKWGARCGHDDLVLYHCSIANFPITRYQFDLYTYAYKAAADEPPYHYGYGYIMPEQLLGSEGNIKIKITCATTHRSLCELTVEYLLIKPLPNFVASMEHTYARHWPRDKLPYDIGRRGCGQTYQTEIGDLIRENTLGSLNRAALHGADMVEINVQLTNDSLPVVYNDHVLRVVHKPSAPIEELIKEHDIMLLPMPTFTQKDLRNLAGFNTRIESHIAFQCLTHEQLLQCKAFRFAAAENGELTCDKLMHEQMPFPLLGDIIEETAPQLGFIIEVKWVQRYSNNRWQDGGFKPGFDRNFYVNQILELVLNNIGTRELIFASDDCDICALLRFKQNRYPVMLYTHDPKCPVKLKDQRVCNFETALYTAKALELYGLIVHVNTLLSVRTRTNFITDLGMIVFTHGTELTEYTSRNVMKSYGVKGLIYDRIDQLNQAGTSTKPQFFMLETPYNQPLFQRLLISELRKKCGYKTESELELEKILREYSKPPSMWTFCVHHTNELFQRKNVYFAVTGNCDVLGNWNPKQAITMKRSTNNPTLWSIEAELPRDRLIAYRYFIYARDPILDPNAELMHLLFWETSYHPRYIRANQRRPKQAELFGQYNKIDRAWIMSNTSYIFFKFFQSPFIWPDDQEVLTLNVRISRLVHRGSVEYEQPTLCDEYDFCEVSTQSSHNQLTFDEQPVLGTRCGEDDLIIFRVMVSNRELTVYRFDFYDNSMCEQNINVSTDGLHYGYCILMPEQLKDSDGCVSLEIIPTEKRSTTTTTPTRVIMKLSYFWTLPLEDADEIFNMEMTYERHWDKYMPNLRIGHRGSGHTYIHENNVTRENTIYSFNHAAEFGAEMIEFDVMLSKEGIPIIYHDFVLHFKEKLFQPLETALKSNDIFIFPQEYFTHEQLIELAGSSNKMRAIIPTDALTLAELQQIRAIRFCKSNDVDVTQTRLLREQLPFATLQNVFEETNPDLGFLIDIKRQQLLINGNWESDAFAPTSDANYLVDQILKVVLPMVEGRRIIFTSYNCDICIMLRYKQNMYPVMQMTSNPDRKVRYLDPRLNTFKDTLKMARAMEFLGTILHVNTVLQNSTTISRSAHRGGMIAFCYGESTMFRPVRTQILKFGIQAIIYDRIDQIDEQGEELNSKFFILETDANKEELAELQNNELKTKFKSLLFPKLSLNVNRLQNSIKS